MSQSQLQRSLRDCADPLRVDYLGYEALLLMKKDFEAASLAATTGKRLIEVPLGSATFGVLLRGFHERCWVAQNWGSILMDIKDLLE